MPPNLGKVRSTALPQPGLFDRSGELRLPPRVAVTGSVHGNPIFGFSDLPQIRHVKLVPYQTKGLSGFIATGPAGEQVFVTPRSTNASLPTAASLIIPDISTADDVLDPANQEKATWLSPRPLTASKETANASEELCRSIVESWKDHFEFKEERRDVQRKGLRKPQIGALYAILAHWTTSDAPATIVMPTGTGKTETMLALLVCAQLGRVMVVVPNTALRNQIAEKFVTLGKLVECGCISPDTRPPIVAKLRHRPKSLQEVEDIFRRANIVVANMQVAGQCTPEIQKRMAELCTHLFIDEAHHIAARTWAEFKRQFDEKPILQFTATPFRTDGKRVDGKFIYSYPLALAQKEGYFRPVTLLPVEEFNDDDADLAIARRAGEQLADDRAAGLDHLLMARVDNTPRADKVVALYRSEFPEFAPVVIHSKVPALERTERLQALLSRKSRILICVDMFGEGFDLPQLKIAAVHDKHKSLAVTLQFVGRFTRDLPQNVGDAHVVANIADDTISDALRNLYAEDADWTFLLKMLSEAATGRAQKRNEILAGFTGVLEEIPLQTLFPRMSAVAYRTSCEQWAPLKIADVIPGAQLHAGPVVNPAANLAIFVTRDEEAVRWGAVKQIQNVEWNLHVMHWNEELGLLFINSSTKDFHEHVAEAVSGSKARVSGKEIFRAMGGLKRLVLTNLGLSHALGKNIRYTMFMGADIAEGLSEASRLNRRMSNVFGLGYEDDERTTVGCSFKGRLWSHKIAYDLSEWIDWCAHIGAKLLNPQISVDDVLSNLIKARLVGERPQLVPVMIMWPEDFQSQPEDRVELEIGGEKAVLLECDLTPASHKDDGPLEFIVSLAGATARFLVALSEEKAEFKQVGGPECFATVRGKRRPLSEWFNEDPPIIHFANGDFLVFNELFELPRGQNRAAFDLKNIRAWDWAGVDLTKESQGPEKVADSIQRRVIERVLAGEFGACDIVFDGDGKGEVADVVAIKRLAGKAAVTLFHCKYSGAAAAGARIDDFYEVCGQAQKSVHWREDPRRLLKHLLHQEDLWRRSGRGSRFEQGGRSNVQQLLNLTRQLVFEYRVVIVQPGLRKSAIGPAFLDVLGATETFLKETYSMPLHVVISA